MAAESKPGLRSDSANPGGFAHLPALDGIRGLAILLVLFFHLFWSDTKDAHGLLALIAIFWRSSYSGVHLFFALSGFLITGILVDTLETPHYFKTFYARRSLRIFPLYYASVLLLAVLAPLLHLHWNGWLPYFLTYTSNLALWRTSIVLDLGRFNIDHFWSLQVEEQFYLVWPFLVFRIRKLSTLITVSLTGCVLILGLRIFFTAMASHPMFSWRYLTYSPTFSCADNILFGCCLAALIRTHWRDRVLHWAPRVGAVCAVILAIFAFKNGGLGFLPDDPGQRFYFVPTIGFTLFALGYTSLIAMALRKQSLTQRAFSNPVLRFFGRYSYGLYVFHYSLAGFFTRPLRAFFFEHSHSKALSVLLGAIVIGLLSIVAAMISYRFFEAPILSLKRYFGYNRVAVPPAIEQPA